MIKKFIKKEPVLVFAWTAAVISGFAVPLNKNYIDYIDFRTLGLLFCLMCVTGGLKKARCIQNGRRKTAFAGKKQHAA